MSKNEIEIYATEDGAFAVEVKLDKETVWLTQKQMAELFGKNVRTINEHIKNIFLENELDRDSVIRNFRITVEDGKDYEVMHYNLDIIISVGYRVKSKRGTQFRIWANKILKEYLLKGYSLNETSLRKQTGKFKDLEDDIKFLYNTIDNKEKKQIEFQIKTENNLNKIFKALSDIEIPNQGVFFENQVYDAYELLTKIIKKAKKSIIIIDNYIDDTVFTVLGKRKKGVNVKILTKNFTKQLKLDLEKYNSQYSAIEIKKIKSSHDRFMILDDKEIYCFGASLKDLGKKWFGFFRVEKGLLKMMERVK